jgi:hypothetical protein
VEEARGMYLITSDVWHGGYLWQDEELVYEIAKFLGESYDEYKDKQSILEQWSLEALRSYIDRAVIPFHSGTIKYLKEKGIWTAEDDTWNEGQLELMDRYEEAWEAATEEALSNNIKIERDNEEWLDLWDSYREQLPIFKVRGA